MAVTNTGSRNGIITWAVFATVLGLASLIWAVISYTHANKADKDLADISKKYNAVIDNAGLAGDSVTRLTEAQSANPAYGGLKLLDVATRQTAGLTTLVAGAGAANAGVAETQAQAAIEAARVAAGEEAALDTGSLVSTVNGLASTVQSLKGNNAQLAASLKEAQDAAAAAQEDKGKLDAASNEKVAAADQRAAESQTNADAYAKDKDAQLTTEQEQRAQLTQTGSQSLDEANGRISALEQQLAQAKREVEERNAQLGAFRVPTDQLLQQADGAISRTGGTDRVFINLGKGDQIAAGMTFEVFDKLGVPRVRPDEPADDKLLKGKASIEVVRVQPGISECRIVRLSPGVAITEGDPIVNVVYDKNVKFNFLVFGKFNLDQRGEATDRDTDVVRRLISGWGATVADQLTAKTDFVVLGEEPVVPAYGPDELAREPEKAFQQEQAAQAQEAYLDLRKRAGELNIPILTQTRFLYMVGYYEEAPR